MAKIELQQTNAYAMQYGVVLGLWHTVTLALTMLSLTKQDLALPAMCMMPGGFFLAIMLTARFRKEVGGNTEGFSIYQGFLHTLLMGLFAAIWPALFTYLYLQFADASWIFEAYRTQLAEPSTIEALVASGMMDDLKMLTESNEPSAIVDLMQDIPPMTYAASLIYMSLFVSPVCALLIGFVCRKASK